MSRFKKIGADGTELEDSAEQFDMVLDTVSGLMWVAGESKGMPQTHAKEHAANCRVGGFEDWRLPTVDELFPLADRSKYDPAIDTTFFPKCKSDWYWTSSPAAYSPGEYAWFVSFYGGGALWSGRGSLGFVRPVRSARVGQ